MGMNYGFYKLTKVPGKKEYTPEVKCVSRTLKAAYEELQSYWDDCLGFPVWINRKIHETVAYKRDDRMLYVPNDNEINGEIRTIGIHGRFPIFYIDVYPNPYSHYKLKRKRGEFYLEGVLECPEEAK